VFGPIVCCKVMASDLLLAFRRVGVVSLLRSNPSKFTRFYSTMSHLLIEEPKYSWLQELGLKADNPGVFCGAWSGQGQVNTDRRALWSGFVLSHSVLNLMSCHKPKLDSENAHAATRGRN